MPSRRSASKKSTFNPLILLTVLGAVVIVAAGAVLLRQGKLAGGTSAGDSSPEEISATQALERREAGAFMLDVREPDEWNQFHMPGATLIPLGELSARVAELPKDQEIVVVCRSGNRSATGRDILREAGFTRVTSMAGGMLEWQSEGYPTVSGP